MKILKKAVVYVLILAFFLSSTDFVQIVNAAREEDSLKVENQFVSYTVNKNNGRFGISTVEGAPRRAGDQTSSLLYKGEKPDTSFTTFRVEGKDYIFGNDYGFLGIQGGMTKSPSTEEGINTSVWKLGDLEVRQQLTLVADKSNPDVGNVKVTYTVINNSKAKKSVGSRILFDTLLGTNDGSPLVIPGIEKPVEHEISLDGEDVPSFWQSEDTDISPEVVSYGLISGWGNKAPNRMTAAHWSGIGSTKWDYQADSTVKFASVFNKYNESDSAVALYWNPEILEPGETRVYETYYGLGVFNTSDGNTFLATMTGPDKLELKEDKTGYVQDEFEISLELDNSLPVSAAMTDVKAAIELTGGLKLAPSQPQERNLGVVERDSRTALTWKVKGELTEFYRIGQATVYLNSESLNDTISYSKYIILPGSSGKLPEIQYTDITPKNLYYQDTRKSFNINGTGFGILKDRSKWELKLVREGSNPVVYTINHKQINVIGDTAIQVLLPDISDIGTYTVKLEHDEFLGCTFSNALNISADTAYKNLKYGILAVTGEAGNTYKLNVFEDESKLDRFNGKDKILLIVRGDIQNKGEGKYEAYSSSGTPAEINDILLYNSSVPISISEDNGSVELAGNGGLSVSGSVTFWKWAFEISLDKGTKYSLAPSDEDNTQKIEIGLTGVAGGLQNMLAGFNLTFNNAYFYKDEDGYSLTFGGSMYLSLGGKKDEGSNSGDANKSEVDDEDDPFKIEANVDKVTIGQRSNNTIGFKGITAEASVGFPKDYFPPPVDIGAEATLSVDISSNDGKSYTGDVGMMLDVDLKVIKVNGEIEFKLIPYPIPNKLYFYVGSDVGVDIIPPVPVATLLGVGGGIDNIYNLVNWDASSPPLTIMVTASAEIGKILKMDKITLSVSWQHAELKGDIGIKGYNIIKDATVRLRWYNPFGFHVSARIEAFDCIEGKVLLNIFKDDFLGMASVRLFVPTSVPVIGGMTIAGAEAGVDMEKLWAELEIISITFGVKYVYGSNFPDFYIGDEGQSPGKLVAALDGKEGLYTAYYRDEETGEEGRIIYGTNVKLIGSSEWDKVYAADDVYIAAAGDGWKSMMTGMPVVIALNDNTYQMNVQNQQAALFEIGYEGSKPDIKVIRPDGKEYMLKEDDINGNIRHQTIPAKDSESGKDEQKVWISVVGPDSGYWKIVSDKPLSTAKLYDVKMAPEFTSISSTKLDNYKVKVDWTGKYTDGAKLNLYLLEEGSSEAGRLLASGIDAAAGTYNVSLPEDVQTGRYVIRAELSKEDYGFTSSTTNTFDITDLKAPDKPGNLKAAPAGNGCLKVSWTGPAAGKYPAQGYLLTVLNEDGTTVTGYPESYVSGRNETIVGGEVTQQDGMTVKLEPGKSYKVSIMAHREDELVPGEAVAKQHYSKPVMSEAVYLPVPKPPVLKLSLKQGEEMLPLNTSESNIDEYYSTGKEAMLSVEADTPSSASIYLNDKPAYSGGTVGSHQCMLTLNEGENNVAIRATNSAGDFTDKVIRIISDTIPPLLLIDSTEIKQSNGTTTAVLKGKCEPGSKLTINGGDAAADKDGIFEYTLIMGDNMSMDVFAAAGDSAGNITEYKNTVYNDTLKAIQKVVINPSRPTMELGESLKLGLNAVDSEGKYLSIKPELVKWSLMADTGTVELNNAGSVKAMKTGKAYIMAEYKVTDGFSHTDAIPVTIVEDTLKRQKTADNKITGPVDVLNSIAAAEKNRKDVYAGRIQPGKKTSVYVDDILSLNIPEGSLNNIADIKISRYDNQEELMKKFPGMRLLSPIYDISLNRDMKPDAPISVSFKYDAGQAEDIRRIAVYRLDEQRGRWDYIGGITDSSTGVITVKLSSFSKYAVLENSNLRLLSDVDNARWSSNAIYSLVHQKIIDGVKIGGEYYFKPDNYITRAEFIKILSAGLGADDSQTGDILLPFADKKDIPDWALAHVKAGFANGWVNGRVVEGKKLFGSDEQITREEACAILGRMLGDTVRPKGVHFSDRDKVAKYAVNYLDILADMGVLSGYEDDTFRPKNFITREEAASMTDRYLKSR